MDGRWTVGTARVLRVVARVFEERGDGVVELGERIRGIESGGKETAEVRGELVGGGFANFLARASRRRRRRRGRRGRRRGLGRRVRRGGGRAAFDTRCEAQPDAETKLKPLMLTSRTGGGHIPG